MKKVPIHFFLSGCMLALALGMSVQSYSQTFLVTTTIDNGDNVSPTLGSLRQGIILVDQGLYDVINFAIPTSDPGYNASQNTWTIAPPVFLPYISSPVIIDGYAGSPGGATPNTLAQATNAIITIVLDGSNYTVGTFESGEGAGLVFTDGSDGSVVRGLSITHWIEQGINVSPINFVTDITVVGCFIGVMPDGTTQASNQSGIGIGFADSCSIGTVAVADRNLINGSFYFFEGGGAIVTYAVTNLSIVNNIIGLDRTGSVALGNSQAGIALGFTSAVVGGNTPAQRNIIAGQTFAGITSETDTTVGPVQISGNYIGTDISGTIALGNGFGVYIQSGGVTVVGGTDTSYTNLVSGNNVGIAIASEREFSVGVSQPVLIQNNSVGTDITQKNLIPNNVGILVVNNSVLPQNSALIINNSIVGNNQQGILVYDAQGNQVSQNTLMLNKNQSSPNGVAGAIQLGLLGGKASAYNNRIGF